MVTRFFFDNWSIYQSIRFW